MHEVAELCIASLPTGVTPIVRACANAIDEATRALDNGALGIVMPHVDTAKEARRIAEAFHYPPRGRRSWGGPPAVYGYQPPSMAEAQKAINDEILTVVMIESPEAVKNADGIAAVDGVDVLLIGTSDLSSELGVAGQMGHARSLMLTKRLRPPAAGTGRHWAWAACTTRKMPRAMSAWARALSYRSAQNFVLMGADRRSSFFTGLPVVAPAADAKKKAKKVKA